MRKVISVLVVLAMAMMMSACAMSLDTINYVNPPIGDKTVDTGTCDEDVELSLATINEVIMFKFDSSEIIESEMKTVKKIAIMMIDHPDTWIIIKGMASTEGDNAYNLALSAERAKAVETVLVNYGIDAERITSGGWGETDEFGEVLSLNRRVVVLSTDTYAEVAEGPYAID
jgi:flagellar motor protein MotB